MKLVSVSIRNFRCLKEVNDIPIHDLTVFIGENDSGKSSILDAIELCLNKKNPTIDDYYICEGEERAGQIIIELDFQYDDTEEKPEDRFLSENGMLKYRGVYGTSYARYEVKGKKYLNDILNSDFPKLKTGEFDEILEQLNISSEDRLNAEKRLALLNEYISNEKPEMVYDWIEIKNQVDQFLPRFEKYSSSDYINPEQMILKTLQMVVESYIYITDENNEKELLPSLEEVKVGLKNELDLKIGELLGFMRRYNPKIEDIEIEPVINFAKGFQTGRMFLTDSTGTYHILNKGEGTRKMLFMSILDWDRKVILETDNRPVIRAYDEPDANLHYEAQRKMFYIINDITSTKNSKIQALICTHSLTMIDRAQASSINLLNINKDGTVCLEYLKSNNDASINDFLCEMSASLGISNSSIFYERCFIFVEGATEENALPILYKKLYSTSIVEDGIKIINIEGCGGWASYVKLMGINKIELLLFLLDDDCNSTDSSCNLNASTLTNLGFKDDF